MYQPVKIISETTSVSQSTADWYREVFSGVSGTSLAVTANGGDLPSNSAKIQVVRNGVIQAIGDDYSVVEPNIIFTEALDDEIVIVTFLSDSDTTSTLIDDIVPLADAKKHLKVDYSDDDDLIQMYIKAARQICEKFMNRALVPKTIEESLGCFPKKDTQHPFRELRLSWGPLIAVDNIKYWDDEDPSARRTIENKDLTDNFVIDTAPNFPVIHPISSYTYPDTDNRKYPATVQYQAGYSSTDLVPQPIKQAMLLLIGEMYEKRVNSVHKMPTAAEYLLNNYVVPHFA